MSDTAPADAGYGLTAALRLSDGFHDLPDGVPVGVLLTHPCAKRGGQVVQDFIPLVTADWSNGWTLVSRDPITITPSVSYTCCSLHGFLRDGKWEPA